VTEEWLKEQSELLYFTGIEKPQQCYKLCVDKGGDYVEKKCMLINLSLLYIG